MEAITMPTNDELADWANKYGMPDLAELFEQASPSEGIPKAPAVPPRPADHTDGKGR
jgi:hypothetical protein